MSDSVSNIIQHLEHASQVYAQIKNDGKLAQLNVVKEWQCDRLLASHYSMWEIKRFQPAIKFFISELYGPKDFSQRDADIARVIPKMEKWLPESAMHSLEVAIHLNSLSQDLDLLLLNNLNIDLTESNALNSTHYANAYRKCNNPEQRLLQIEHIEKLGMDLAKVVKIPGISMILKMARTPAKTIGVESLQQFLEDGFQAFKTLGKVEDFIIPVVTEERRIMQAIFDGEDVLPDI